MGLLSILLVIIACGMVWCSPRIQRRKLRAARLGYLQPKPHVPEGFQQILVPSSLVTGILAMIRGKAAHEYLNDLNGHEAHFLHQAVCAAFDHGIITAAQRKTLLQVNRAANIAKHSSLCKQKKVTLVLDELVKRDNTDNAGGGAIDLVHAHGFRHGAASSELSLDCAFGGKDSEDEYSVVASSAVGGSGGNPSGSSGEAKERISECGSKVSASCGIAIEAEDSLHGEVLAVREEAKQEHDAVISSFLGLLSHGVFGDRALQKVHTEDAIRDSLLTGSVVHEDEFLHDERRPPFNDNTVENNLDFVHEVDDEKKALAEESAKSMLRAGSDVHEDGEAGNLAGFEALTEDSDSLPAGSDVHDDGALHDDRRHVFTDFTVENNLEVDDEKKALAEESANEDGEAGNFAGFEALSEDSDSLLVGSGVQDQRPPFIDNTVENNHYFVHEVEDEKKALAEESATCMLLAGSDVHEDGEAGNSDGVEALPEDSDSLLVGSDVHDVGSLHDDRRQVFTDFTVENNLDFGHEVEDEKKALSEVSALGLLPAGRDVHANDVASNLAGFGDLPEENHFAGTLKLSQQCMWTDICSSDDGSESADGVHDYSDFSLHDGDRASLHVPFDQSVRWHLVGGVWTKAAGHLQQVQQDRWHTYGEVSASCEEESSISPQVASERQDDSEVHGEGLILGMISPYRDGLFYECVSSDTFHTLVQMTLQHAYSIAYCKATCHDQVQLTDSWKGQALCWEQWREGFLSSFRSHLHDLREVHKRQIEEIVTQQRDELRVAWDLQLYSHAEFLAWYGSAGDRCWREADPKWLMSMLASLCNMVDSADERVAQMEQQILSARPEVENLKRLNQKLIDRLSCDHAEAFCGYCHSHFKREIEHGDFLDLHDNSLQVHSDFLHGSDASDDSSLHDEHELVQDLLHETAVEVGGHTGIDEPGWDHARSVLEPGWDRARSEGGHTGIKISKKQRQRMRRRKGNKSGASHKSSELFDGPRSRPASIAASQFLLSPHAVGADGADTRLDL